MAENKKRGALAAAKYELGRYMARCEALREELGAVRKDNETFVAGKHQIQAALDAWMIAVIRRYGHSHGNGVYTLSMPRLDMDETLRLYKLTAVRGNNGYIDYKVTKREAEDAGEAHDNGPAAGPQ